MYSPAMAKKRDAQFASDLARMSDEEVHQQIEPTAQPVPILRAMAVTELERRRQKKTDALLRPNISLGRVAVGVAMLAAIGVWLWWAGYVG